MKGPQYQCEYPALQARRYGVVIHNGQSHTLVDPVETMLAEAFLTKASELEVDIRTLFSADRLPYGNNKYSLALPDGKKRARLEDFSPKEMALGLEAKLREYGHHKIWW
jgi:hypothetical protein